MLRLTWTDSACYLVRRSDQRLRLTVEHRAAPAPDPLLLSLSLAHTDGQPLRLQSEVLPIRWTPHDLGRGGVHMAQEKKTYPAEFKRRMVELVRAGRSPEELSRESITLPKPTVS